MSVRVRLTRVGSKKNPIWRVVVADQRSPRDGRTIETLGHYNPQTDPSTIVIDRERLDHWIEQGAQPTDSVRKLVRAPNTPMPEPSTPDAVTAEVVAAAEAEEAAEEVAVAEAGEAEAAATEQAEVEASIEADAAAADEATPESDAQVESEADTAADAGSA